MKTLVFEFIRAYIGRHGVSPSYEVMAKGLGMRSKANMHRYVRALERDGLLKVRPRKFYGIQIVGDKSVEEIINL